MKRSAMKGALGASTALALSLTLAGCGGSASGEGANVDPLVKGYDGPSVDMSGVSLTLTTSEADGLNLGSFWAADKMRQWGADVNVVVLTSTSGIQTMMAGKSDVASQGADEVILGNAEGAGVVAIGSPRTKQSYVLVAKNEINSVADLKGRSIAMSGPSGFDTLLSKYALENAGLSDSDAKLVQVGGSPDRASALLSGTVDAATIFLSGWEELQAQTDKVHQLVSFGDSTDFPGSAYYAKASYLKDNPTVGLGLACANLEANDWINSDESQYLKYAQEQIEGASVDGLKQLWKDATAMDMWPTDPSQVISSDGMDGLAKAMLKSGEIKKEVSTADAVDTSFLQKAADMGCGQ
ncbi:MAG TPA: ABC transporter substrate-binding protein [Nocardioidaceae bacterium]|nr:ABC transporter substrate-binding protein [Nocardioidaceae bacterium]